MSPPADTPPSPRRPQGPRAGWRPALAGAALAAAYALGNLGQDRGWSLVDAAATAVRPHLAALRGHGRTDELGRLQALPGKTERPCPPPGRDLAVLLVLGQSNAANHGEQRLAPRRPEAVLQWHDGRCWAGGSPHLGATGQDGEFLTPLADRLIDSGAYRQVLTVSAAVGSTSIARWQPDSELHVDLLARLARLQQDYRVSAVLWHQGESDHLQRTTEAVYRRTFDMLRGSLTQAGVAAPIFIAVATRCGPKPQWHADNPVARAQRALVNGRDILLGADTDTLLGPDDRQADGCHLSERGQQRTAEAFADALRQARLP